MTRAPQIWDREQVQIQDGFVPLSSWDDKIAAAMRRCKQEKHLTKEGALLGPACPRLRLPSASSLIPVDIPTAATASTALSFC